MEAHHAIKCFYACVPFPKLDPAGKMSAMLVGHSFVIIMSTSPSSLRTALFSLSTSACSRWLRTSAFAAAPTSGASCTYAGKCEPSRYATYKPPSYRCTRRETCCDNFVYIIR